MGLLGLVLAIVVIAIFWRIFAGLALIVVALCILVGAYMGLFPESNERHYDHTNHSHPARR